MIWLIRIICFSMSIGMLTIMFSSFENIPETNEIIIKVVAGILLGILLNIWYKAEREK